MAISNLLTNPINSYPVFKPNQVLTEAQLNRMVDYADQQNRLTRVLLLGTGVACGLEPVWKDGALHVSPGFGVTSEGYLISEPGGTLANGPDAVLNRYRLLEKVAGTLFGLDGITQFDAFGELSYLADATSNSDVLNGTVALTQDHLKNQVLIYVMQIDQQDNQGLCNNDCDGRSDTRQFTVRKLLFSEANARRILHEMYEIDTSAADLSRQFYYKYFIPHLIVPRFGYSFDEEKKKYYAQLDTIVSYTEFHEKYGTVLDLLAKDIDDALQKVYQIFSPLLTPGEARIFAPAVSFNIKKIITDRSYHRFEVQYIYNYLCDLVDAYNEFVETAFDLVADCNFGTKHFPNHLIIRKFNAAGEPETEAYSAFRTPYTQPPIYNGNQNRLQESRLLLSRLTDMATGYAKRSTVGADPIKITPSKSNRVPLSERAMPFYYAADFVKSWSPYRQRLHRAGQVYAYERPANTLPYSDPLIYRMEGSDFLRIEGHVGSDFHTVMTDLDQQRRDYNLPFEIAALKIGDTFDSDIFQFECESVDCKIAEKQLEYEKITVSYIDNINQSNATTDQEQELRLFLPPALKDFKPEELEKSALFNSFKAPALLAQTEIKELSILSDCYFQLQKKRQAILDRHLFHHFASAYPGLEHGGGVPMGGTFVLVYVEPGEINAEINEIIAEMDKVKIDPDLKPVLVEKVKKSRLVVGDFYLPYACVSNCIPICYMVSRPVPIFIVSPAEFCANDITKRPLKVTTHPSGGIVTGSGHSLDGLQHYFTPSGALPDGQTSGQVTLSYNVDGAVATAVVLIKPAPDAAFRILDKKDGEEVPEIGICKNAKSAFVEPPAGTYSVWDGLTEIKEAIKDGVLDLEKIPITGTSDPVSINIRREIIGGNLCPGQSIQSLQVWPDPNADFNLDGIVNTNVCLQEDMIIQLIPVQAAGDHEFTYSSTQGNGVIDRNSIEQYFFNPNEKLSLKPGESLQVVFRHRITSPAGCAEVGTKTIQFSMPPPAIFSIQGDDTICWDAAPVELLVDPSVPAAAAKTFTATFNGTTITLPDETLMFNPNTIPQPPEQGTQVTIRMEVRSGPCVVISDEQTITVRPAPEADFRLLFADSNSEITVVRVDNIKPVPDGNFNWSFDPEPNQEIDPANNGEEFEVFYPSDVSLPITVTLEVRRGGCITTVRKELKPSILQFALESVDQNGSRKVVRSPLEDGAKVFRNEIGISIERFNIRAITLPDTVHHVRLELVGGDQNTNIESFSNGFYRIAEPPSSLTVESAEYTINAIPFGNENADSAGEPLKVTFTILDSPPPPQPPTPPGGGGGILNEVKNTVLKKTQPPNTDSPSEGAITFLRKRDNAYRTSVSELGQEEALAQTEAFRAASSFLTFQGGVNDFNKRYKAISEVLLAAIGKADDAQRTQLLQLLTIATQYFMDKQAFQETRNLSLMTTQTLKSQLKAMKKAGLKMADLSDTWNGEALQAQLSAPSVGALLRLLK